MRSQVHLGTLFGIRIGLHLSWFLIAFLIGTSLFSSFRMTHPDWSVDLIFAMAVATAVMFFVSLLLHELSHSLVAKARGLPVKEITLFALGGVSQIEKEPTSAKTEFWMALVGPLTSAAIGLICLGLGALLGNPPFGAPPATPATTMLAWLGYINIALAVFNMIPGYPLDGGRILRSAIWWKTGDVDKSTQISARVGQATAAAFIAIGVVQFFSGAGLGGLWISFIGWFLMQASGASYIQSTIRKPLEETMVRDVMTRDCPSVEGNMNLQTFVDHELLRSGRRCFFVVDQGQIAGIVTPPDITGVERGRWPYTVLDDVMRPLADLRTIGPDASLAQALEIVGRENLNQLPVVQEGRLEGVISRAEIVNFLRTRAELQSKGLG